MSETGVVLLSGGLDSATTLAMAAKRDGVICHTLAVDYGQRHAAELAAAERVAAANGARSHRVVKVDLRAIGGSALTDDIAVPERSTDGIPVTYVPARNTVLLAVAMGYAETLAADAIYAGVNAIDYSGYPDCRPAFVTAFQALMNVATRQAVQGSPPQLRTPLLELGKAQIIRAGLELGVDYAQTVSCYQPDASGRACGRCEACRLRQEGFADAGVADPTRYLEARSG